MTLAAGLPTGRRGTALALGMLLIALAVLAFGIVVPLDAWYAGRATSLATSRTLARHMAAIATTLPALRAEAKHTASSGPPEAAMLSGTSDAVAAAALQGLIETMARRSGASLASTDILPSEPKGPYRRIALHLAASGSYAVVVALIDAIGRAEPRMVIDDLSLHGPAIRAPGASKTIEAQFSVIAFRKGGATSSETARQRAVER